MAKRLVSTILLGIIFTYVGSSISMGLYTTFFRSFIPEIPVGRVTNFSILSIIFPVVISPIVEEYLIRIKLLPFLIKKIGKIQAVLLSSFIFSILHGQLFLLPYFINSLIYSWVYLKTKKGYSSIIVHSFYNLLAIIGH